MVLIFEYHEITLSSVYYINAAWNLRLTLLDSAMNLLKKKHACFDNIVNPYLWPYNAYKNV